MRNFGYFMIYMRNINNYDFLSPFIWINSFTYSSTWPSYSSNSRLLGDAMVIVKLTSWICGFYYFYVSCS
ncbi:unnamed protein product [Blepharisma stoltei]|uniref:Cytochrome oxidase subunit I n=1 Tax=Blepharisma stoltei TaxID=1481888 RepID=A0AAU9JHC7_9CILI|nr:unnamed protein product [Blepharisma stoltei]